MITGEIKNRIDTIWDAFWTGGITNSITILEQMTYLFFMKMLDDAQKTKEANASIMGVAVKDPTFGAHIPIDQGISQILYICLTPKRRQTKTVTY